MSDDEQFMMIRGSVAEELTERVAGKTVTRKLLCTLIKEIIRSEELGNYYVQAAVDAVQRYKAAEDAPSNYSDPPNAPKRRRTETRSHSSTDGTRTFLDRADHREHVAEDEAMDYNTVFNNLVKHEHFPYVYVSGKERSDVAENYAFNAIMSKFGKASNEKIDDANDGATDKNTGTRGNVAPSTPPRQKRIASHIEDASTRGHPLLSLCLPENDAVSQAWKPLLQRKQEGVYDRNKSWPQPWKPWSQAHQEWDDVKKKWNTGSSFQSGWQSSKDAWGKGNQKARHEHTSEGIHTKSWGSKKNWQTSNGWYYKTSGCGQYCKCGAKFWE